MEEKQQSPNKPLRTASNKIKDIYNTYIKQDEGRTIPITTNEDNVKEDKEQMEVNAIELDNSFTEEEVADFLSKIEELSKEKEELKEQMLRNAAELENFRRRTMREKQEIVEYANERLLYKLLEIPDTLSAAIDSAKKSKDFDSFLTGIELTLQKTMKLFEESGVKPIEDIVGKEFSVDLMDALMVMPSDITEGHVAQIISPGYMINEKVLRHVKVVTSSGPVKDAIQE
jgi:molecular chaperone GrpE